MLGGFSDAPTFSLDVRNVKEVRLESAASHDLGPTDLQPSRHAASHERETRETHLPGQHLVQQDAVGPPVHGLPVRLIGDYL